MVKIYALKHCVLLSERNETFSCCSTMEKTLLSLPSTNIFPPKKVDTAQKHYLFLFVFFFPNVSDVSFCSSSLASLTCPKISLKLSVAVGSGLKSATLAYRMQCPPFNSPSAKIAHKDILPCETAASRISPGGGISLWKGRTGGSVGCGPLGFSLKPRSRAEPPWSVSVTLGCQEEEVEVGFW